ncbi:type I-F CRISPR-associated helicase Cas3f [Castellaniella sp.]|uniref:type I-F CRISPR-associated helicase Cas3f n=1 Tax=Castellaniella sp. TaxID=1955812 RepID=UPI002AFE23FA|nr:type I-F CRISPR-associated helicase Cas3f [Castellaniella sp.]
MNVLLVSQCSKRALTETRRILDQFAERRGDRTWQTAITQAGLATLRKLLRQTARKNTAVACHWIRGRDHSELLWIVGDTRQFNVEGAVPTNMTKRNILRRDDENDWHSLRMIRRMAALAALLHDLGKASQSFQDRLQAKSFREKNRYRHEWVSVRLFQAFVGSDDDAGWLQRLIDAGSDAADGRRFEKPWLDWKNGRLLRDGKDPEAQSSKPFASAGKGLPPLAQAVAWLVFTHHRLPAVPRTNSESESINLWHGRSPLSVNGQALNAVLGQIDADWNEPWPKQPVSAKDKKVVAYWTFNDGLPVRTAAWRKRAARIAKDLLQDLPTISDCLRDPFLMHVSRLALMLGDHHYSGLEAKEERVKGEDDFPLFANTNRATGKPLQRLDEHLLGVELHAGRIVHSLPSLTRDLPRLIGHRGLKKRSANPAFRWQDKAADLAAGVRQRAAEQGAFIVNMASTGCGKTLGNARIMNALADPVQGLRCAFAIGLRALTLQTGRSFQRDLGLEDEELAIQVGGAAHRAMFEYYAQLAEDSGSASRQALLDETTHIVYEGNDQHPILDHLGRDPAARRLLAAPLLVCTVDHLTPATEGLRGGRQIAPMLRLLTGDLVLDEPDDFDLSDLPALARLVHWAGLLGTRVLLSSATLPPALVQGLFTAYLEGRQAFQKHRGVRPSETPSVCCLWIDEFAQAHADCPDPEFFAEQHQVFADKRVRRLEDQVERRRAALLPLPDQFRTEDKGGRREAFASLVRDAALCLHAEHANVDPRSGKRISFGLVRMANIDPLIDVALALFRLGAPQGVHIHLCVYHARFPLFLRSRIEYRLDRTLDRRQEAAVFDLPEVRQAIDAQAAQNQLFMVLGSPVTEVGRDHDYDWAVVEPSSMRSLIQLAGRVWRHRRQKSPASPNLLVFNHNLKHFDRANQPAYCQPGFENTDFPLRPHDLTTLLAPWLDQNQSMPIDARLRVQARSEADRQIGSNLVDLEHARMEHQMLAPIRPHLLNATSFWMRNHAWLTGFLQQTQPFRADPQADVELMWQLDEDERPCLYRLEDGERKFEKLHVPIDTSQRYDIPDEAVRGDGVSHWGDSDLSQCMIEQAEAQGMPLDQFAQKFTRTRVPVNQAGWRWHPALGFAVVK